MASTDALTYLDYCQLTGSDPDERTEVQVCALISAVTRSLELTLNCYFVQREYVEEHITPHAPTPYPCLSWEPIPAMHNLVLKKRPVQTVSEVKDLGGVVIPASDYQLIRQHAFLYHPRGWPAPDGGWLITQTGGHFPSTGEVTSDVKQAVTKLVQVQVDSGQSGGAVQTVSSEQVGPVKVTYAIPTATSGITATSPNFEALPPQVQSWLWPYLNLGGLGS